MIWEKAALVPTLALLALLAPLERVYAQPPAQALLGIEGAVAIPIAATQGAPFGPGGSLIVSAQLPLTHYLNASARLQGTLLSDGPPPPDPTLRDPGVGSMGSLSLGLRLRPFAALDATAIQRARGGWIELDAGAALTGTFVRPTFEVGIGWAFEVDDVRIGPAMHFLQVLHFDDPLDSSPASILLLGAEIVLFDRRSEPPVEVDPVPPSDVDGDGVLDDDDACRTDPEDRDGYQDEDGCPDPDNDGDGVLDLDDRCPLEAEDTDAWQDQDGCPDLDNDGDRVPDVTDACPNEAEVLNGIDDEDGCPDTGLIEMIEDRIVIEERVLFDFGLAHVKHTARPTLQAIVDLWRQHPEWARVRIEGHADARGNPALNQHLSELRAEHVRDVLVELGMPTEMIEVVGYGSTRLRDTRGTEEAHRRNRRVEFIVTARHPASPAGTSDARAVGGEGGEP